MRLMKSTDENDHPKVCVTGSRGPSSSLSTFPSLLSFIPRELSIVFTWMVLMTVDGLVLTFTPYSHNYNYRSAMLHGTATYLDPITDYQEKLFAMELITNHVFP